MRDGDLHMVPRILPTLAQNPTGKHSIASNPQVINRDPNPGGVDTLQNAVVGCTNSNMNKSAHLCDPARATSQGAAFDGEHRALK